MGSIHASLPLLFPYGIPCLSPPELCSSAAARRGSIPSSFSRCRRRGREERTLEGSRRVQWSRSIHSYTTVKTATILLGVVYPTRYPLSPQVSHTTIPYCNCAALHSSIEGGKTRSDQISHKLSQRLLRLLVSCTLRV